MTVKEHDIEDSLRLAKIMLDRSVRLSDGYSIYRRVEYLAHELDDVLKKFTEKHQSVIDGESSAKNERAVMSR